MQLSRMLQSQDRTWLYSFTYSTASVLFFFFNAPATTEIYTLSLHDALPILRFPRLEPGEGVAALHRIERSRIQSRSEEHTSELQSQFHLVCRLLLEKKKVRDGQLLF